MRAMSCLIDEIKSLANRAFGYRQSEASWPGGGAGGQLPLLASEIRKISEIRKFSEILYLFDFWHKLGVRRSTRSNFIHTS